VRRLLASATTEWAIVSAATMPITVAGVHTGSISLVACRI